MRERIAVFLFSAIMVLGSLAMAGWMIATGQVVDMDGIFLFLVLLLFALVFFICIMSLIKGAIGAAADVAPVKAAPAAQKAATAPPAQSQAAPTH
jgi:bacteriorhodopsin